MILPQLLLATW